MILQKSKMKGTTLRWKWSKFIKRTVAPWAIHEALLKSLSETNLRLKRRLCCKSAKSFILTRLRRKRWTVLISELKRGRGQKACLQGAILKGKCREISIQSRRFQKVMRIWHTPTLIPCLIWPHKKVKTLIECKLSKASQNESNSMVCSKSKSLKKQPTHIYISLHCVTSFFVFSLFFLFANLMKAI